MTDTGSESRHDRRPPGHAALERRPTRLAQRAKAEREAKVRRFAFGGIVVAVLAIGVALAFGDFFTRPSGAPAGEIDVPWASSTR